MRAVSLLAALVIAGALVACGDDSDGSAEVAEGTGYEVTVPDGWTNESDQGEDLAVEGIAPEVVLAGGRRAGFTSNMNVVVTNETASLDAQTSRERRILKAGKLPGSDAEATPALDLSPVERIEVDGEDARAYEFGLEQAGVRLQLRQIIVVRGEQSYAITYTAHPDGFDVDLPKFEEILDSWSWS